MRILNDTTIVAISSASGIEGAIGIVRLSGVDALKIANKVFKSKSGKPLSKETSRYMMYGHITSDDKIYDEVLAVYFAKPHTYTTEDLVEFQCHGNVHMLDEIVSLLIKNGATQAENGEFTKRAFLGGRLDLSQAEAVMDMVSAKTSKGFDIALKQLGGYIGRKIDPMLDKFTDLLAQIEVTIDYPDEDIEALETEAIKKELELISADITDMISSFDNGKIYKEGITMSIIGIPNVGKSSFMNSLLNEERAIVTDIAGTTRDIIKEWVNIEGIPVNIIDTAGIRATEDVVEKIGVEKSKEIFNESDFSVIMLSANEKLTDDEKLFIELSKGKKSIILINKCDLKAEKTIDDVLAINQNAKVINVSVKNEIGIDEFKSQFKKMMLNENITNKSSANITNKRHLSALMRGKESVADALNSLNMNTQLDLVQIDLLNAYTYLGEITGKTIDDDVVGRIFEKFCLGK